ncbi:LCP family protein [Staphylococcus arlettae]|uniref:LCP family protein n=1 Tax=Staphylococcus TaxID=1279 RepID=UPI001438313F|nr:MULTISPECIES: LCP family protein [Staphylococcus]MCD8849204.1 LCP family protein [Staphylococcus arlettae]MCD8908516.1 LCP family protein [Staphylococcus arlettae]MCE4986452.1 LCP family protein [Staphylococcus arlettae]NKE85983.1 LCP family protein [Staphylococcus arlettae]URN38470.1 LCP family protein [Staphylococcus arlettae]
MNKLFKYLLILLSLGLVVIPVIYTIMLFKASQGAIDDSFNGSDSNRKSNLRDTKINPSKDPVSILFLGIDENEQRKKNGQSASKSRTDAMIFSTLNPDTQQLRMLSIPRDTISYIPKVGYYDKITHAHAYGGPIASMDAVEGTLNVPVDYYVRINMEAFVDAVNELDGIYYDVPYNLNEPNTDDTGKIKVKKGYQKLNGDEALAVARTRHNDSDLKRGQRQMELIKLLIAKAQKQNSFSKLDDVIKIVGNNSKHNLNSDEVKSLATTYLKSNLDIETTQLEGEDDYLNNVYYYNPDINSIMKTSNLLRKDLDLPKIEDADKFLNQRVTDFYGTLVPQTEIDQSLLRKNQQDSSQSEDESNDESNTNQQQNDTQNMDPNMQQDDSQNSDQNMQQDNSQNMDPNMQQNGNNQSGQSNETQNNDQMAPSADTNQSNQMPTGQY